MGEPPIHVATVTFGYESLTRRMSTGKSSSEPARPSCPIPTYSRNTSRCDGHEASDASATLTTLVAKCIPMHLCAPAPNGMKASRCDLSSRRASLNRSGSKACGSVHRPGQ